MNNDNENNEITNNGNKDIKDIKTILPMMALDEVPTPKQDAKDIVALVKSKGSVTGYKLSNGQTVSRDEGVHMAERGEIRGVGVAHKKDTKYLKSLPDGTEDNNLSHLPSVKG